MFGIGPSSNFGGVSFDQSRNAGINPQGIPKLDMNTGQYNIPQMPQMQMGQQMGMQVDPGWNYGRKMPKQVGNDQQPFNIGPNWNYPQMPSISSPYSQQMPGIGPNPQTLQNLFQMKPAIGANPQFLQNLLQMLNNPNNMRLFGG